MRLRKVIYVAALATLLVSGCAASNKEVTAPAETTTEAPVEDLTKVTLAGKEVSVPIKVSDIVDMGFTLESTDMETIGFNQDCVGYFKSPVRSQNHRYYFCSVQCFGGYEYYGRTDYCGKEPVLLFRNECNAGGGGCMYYRFYLFNDVGPVGRFDDRHDSGCRDFLLYGDSLRMHVVTGRIGPDERSPSKLFL